MKTRAFIFLAVVFSSGFLGAAEAPRGSLLELHACALYAGGCVVSSQSTLGGRYMLRAWQFTAGSFAATDFTGLRVALLETSSENLAETGANAEEALVYLPENATGTQRDALIAWMKSNVADLKTRKLQTRVLPLHFIATPNGWTFSAGDAVSVSAGPPEACPTGSCGEALWYEPRSAATFFTVGLNRSSMVSEPLLKLRWTDSGKRSVFLARFDGAVTTEPQYLGAANLCGLGKEFKTLN